jgi:asparagine synthase (glutamine-hydrolysing)
MCGLAGVLAFEGAPAGAAPLERMGAALGHRGPDAEGRLTDDARSPRAWLVHRRLSIIDLSEAANQPLADEEGRVHALLNGEIYNFQALRAELEARGHVFRTRGDTEVALRGYLEHGEGFVSRLDGMFALALWDARRRTLLLARDPFGKKPIYYWHDGARFVFGSEIKALLAAGVPAEMAAANLPEYLAFGYVPTPRTLFRGIRRLPAASVLTVGPAGVGEPVRYWHLRYPPAVEESRDGFEDAARRVRALLADAVKKRLVADVPVGVLLSGGVDSSAVAALAARHVPGRLQTFCVGFEGDAFYDERPHAAAVARHIGAEHHESVVRPRAAELVETLLAHHDEPFGDSSALPTYLVSREARRHVTVALNGDGGDELFAGYDRFHAALLAARLPRVVRLLARGAAGWLPAGSTFHSPLRRLRRFTDKAVRGEAERLAAWGSFFDVPEIESLLANGAGRVQDEVLASYREALAECPDATPLARALHLNARTYLHDDLLPKMDRMSMAHGLETRSPLLDRALAEYAASLPDGYKRRGGAGKRVLKRAVEDLLPAAILRRRKHGFGVPLGEWFRGELRPMVEDVLLAQPRLGHRLRVERVRALFHDHLARRADHGHQLWTLLTLELWMRRHGFE